MKNLMILIAITICYLTYSGLATFGSQSRYLEYSKALLHVVICALIGYSIGQSIAALIVG